MENLDIIKPEKIVEIANEKGKSFSKIKTNQIRNFYSSVNSLRQSVNEKMKLLLSSKEEDKKRAKEIEDKIHAQLILLEPKMAYAAGRQKDVKPFYELVKESITAYKNATNKHKAVNNFILLIESIVAYHKFYGGE